MVPVEQMLRKMKRAWILEHYARGVALVLGLAVDGCLLCLLLHRLVGLPLAAVAAPAALAAAAIAAVVLRARAAAPSGLRLAQLLDRRAGTADLFASAMEFRAVPARFGWLGELTCELARGRAAGAALRPRWSLGSARAWAACGSAAVVMLAAYVVAGAMGPAGKPPAGPAVVVLAPREIASTAKPPAESPATAEAAAPAAPAVAAEAPPPPTSEPAVQITNDMIDKYLAQMPAAADVDLTGVTPIRWDSDEASGKDNPQNQPTPEKIDPVKLDAALLKDLQDAKKKKDESGGKEGGVDIAVISDKGDTKVKGKEGGKDGGESLANAVSRDPRGQPSRLAAKPVPKGVQVRSFARTDSRRKGEERPMGLPDFLSALEQLKSAPPPAAAADSTLAPQPAGDRAIRQESVHPQAAALAEEYFGQLRKADR